MEKRNSKKTERNWPKNSWARVSDQTLIIHTQNYEVGH